MNAKNSCLWAALAAALLAAPGPARADESAIAMGIGTQKILSVPGLQRVAVGDPSVADVKPVGHDQLLLVGSGEGRTTLIVWLAGDKRVTYTLNVRKTDIDDTSADLHRLLGEREGITIRSVGERIFLEGQAYTAEDAERAATIASLYPNVVNLVKQAPAARRLRAEQVNLALQRAGFKNARAVVVGDTLFLEGSVESPEDRAKAELIARSILDAK